MAIRDALIRLGIEQSPADIQAPDISATTDAIKSVQDRVDALTTAINDQSVSVQSALDEQGDQFDELADSVESAGDRIESTNQRSSVSFEQLARSVLQTTRGIVLLGASGDDLDGLVENLARIQGTIDTFSGSRDSISQIGAALSEATEEGGRLASALPSVAAALGRVGTALTGPVGVGIAGALAVGGFLWSKWASDVEEANERAQQAIEETRREQEQANDQIRESQQFNDRNAAFQNDQQRLASLRSELQNLGLVGRDGGIIPDGLLTRGEDGDIRGIDTPERIALSAEIEARRIRSLRQTNILNQEIGVSPEDRQRQLAETEQRARGRFQSEAEQAIRAQELVREGRLIRQRQLQEEASQFGAEAVESQRDAERLRRQADSLIDRANETGDRSLAQRAAGLRAQAAGEDQEAAEALQSQQRVNDEILRLNEDTVQKLEALFQRQRALERALESFTLQ